MKKIMKRFTSMFLVLAMVITMLPTPAMAAAGGINESLVQNLAAVYDGDETRAREELDALHEAGIIDENGNLVELDVKEDGESAELNAVAERIADGETVGAITVNGHDATPDQILQIRQVNSMLEVLRLMDEDVEITDEHVDNLQKLLEGIADGSVDLNESIEQGALRLSSLKSTGMLDAAGDDPEPELKTIPDSELNEGKDAYKQNRITVDTETPASEYTENAEFPLADPENKQYYVNPDYSGESGGGSSDGDTGNGVITIDASYISFVDKIIVTVALDTQQTVPITFDYKFTSIGQNITACNLGSGANGINISNKTLKDGVASGTVTIPANDSPAGGQGFEISAVKNTTDSWNGGRPSLLINMSNIRNATFSGGGTAFSKTYMNSSKTDSVSSGVSEAAVTSFTVPAGTYYSGERVPVTVELDNYVKADSSTKLKINNTDCQMFGVSETEGAGIYSVTSKKLTFGYTVKEVDSGSLSVGEITGLKNSSNASVSITAYPDKKSFGKTDAGVVIVSEAKRGSLDLDNVKYGISDDDAGDQVVTYMIPFKTDANKDWVSNETVPFASPISMPVPDHSDMAAVGYLPTMYLSPDGGTTRYPLYVDDNATALWARFVPKMNGTTYLRKDIFDLFMDTAVGSETNYLGEWTEKKTDAKGYAYFEPAEGAEAAPVLSGAGFSYYLKGGVLFDENEYKIRGEGPYTPESGFLKIDSSYVWLQDAENPGNQYDVEIVADEDFYNAAANVSRAEDNSGLTLSYQWSDRKSFSFTDAKNFTWESSDETVAKVATAVTGGKTVARISFTGKAGTVKFTLHVGNGSESKAYDLTTGELTVLEGKTPFLNIPEFSKERMTLTNTDTDMLFASNMTARNAAVGKGTAFAAKLYKVNAVDAEPSGNPAWTGSFESTVENTLTHITVPGAQLPDAGIYALVISTKYEGGTVDGVPTASQELSATAYLNVKQAPLKVTFDTRDSYGLTFGETAELAYSIVNSTGTPTVQYTIQKSGEPVGERQTASGGSITFTPATGPEGMKDSYIITIYARSDSEEPWSTDSMMLTVYTPDFVKLVTSDVEPGQIGGTTGGAGESPETVDMSNMSKLESYGVSGQDIQLDYEDLTKMRTDFSLQKNASVNYNSGKWGMVSDKVQWDSSDPDHVSVNYKQGGLYSDIRNYSYVTYGPATNMLLVGKDDTADGESVTITATHAATGQSASIQVTAKTLKDQLYVFQFNPKASTTVIYTNGNNEKRTLQSDEKGGLAVYEPSGIASSVMAMSRVMKGGSEVTYVGTVYPGKLVSGEGDIAALQLYPCNNLRMRAISNASLTFRLPNGQYYNGAVTIRGGVYKNGVYCPDARLFLTGDTEGRDGRKDIAATVTNGKLNIGFDPSQFKIDPADPAEYGAQPEDRITYVFEYRINNYRPGYLRINAYTDAEGAQRPTDSLIVLKAVSGGSSMPQIMRQTLQQYYENKPVAYTRDVTFFTENIGPSRSFDKVTLTTEIALQGEETGTDGKGYTTASSEAVADFALYTINSKLLTGQSVRKEGPADQIIDLSKLEDATLFVFPFSSFPITRGVYTMTDSNMKADGITDEGEAPLTSTRVRALYVRNGVTVKSEALPFGVSNLSHQIDLIDPESGAKNMGSDIKGKLKGNLDIGEIFKSINVNDMIRKGFVFLSNLQGDSGDGPFNMMILPTENPGVFRIVAFIGYDKKKNDEDDSGLTLDYDPDQMYDDMNEFAENLDKVVSGDDDDDDEDGGGEGSVDFNFYGTVILEAGWDISKEEWRIDFCGGNVGANFAAKYEWSQTFMCGPVPALISFEVGATVDLEVSFVSKSGARAMLVDAAAGVSIEAFAGLGFDLSIVAFKLGIFGRIGADVNFLYLTNFREGADNNPTGTKLDIAGEIGIRMEIKILLIKYKKTFASTGFNWSKKWGKYDYIQDKWENEGYADLVGVTQGGRAYAMRLFPDGTALVAVDGGGVIEDRDYLELTERAWNSGTASGRRMRKSADTPVNILTNAYPYADPVLTDDGSMFFYISDNDNEKEPESVVNYAVRNGDVYEDKGAVDTSGDSIPSDSSVASSGSGSNVFAAWVKQLESPDKEMKDEATNDDLGMMMNATEIYAGAYDGTAFTVERLTDNSVADMAPTVASSGNRAIVAWRSLNATEMPEKDSNEDLTAMFNAENNINYRIYNGTNWTDAEVAYNGSAGTVNAIDSAMLSDGTSLLTYTVRTGEDVTSSESFYTVIDAEGTVLTTGRLTNDTCTDTNVQVAAVGDQFVLGWYSEHDAGVESVPDPEDPRKKETVTAHDIRLARINKNGSLDAGFPESIGGDSESGISSDFHFSQPAGNADLGMLSIVWSQTKESEEADDAGKYEINAVRFYETEGDDSVIGVTAPTDIAETTKNFTVDRFDTYTDESGKVYTLILGSDYDSMEGVQEFDTIDLSSLGIQENENEADPDPDTLTIMEQNPVAYIRLGSGTFPDVAVDAEAEANLYELMPGLDLPVQFRVENAGTDIINSVNVKLGTEEKNYTGLGLLPGQGTLLVMDYPVPEQVADADYTVTADGKGIANGTLMLNRPDVGITGMKILREEKGQRDIQVTLANASNIPLVGSGKKVMLGFYSDEQHHKPVGETVTIPEAGYADIDGGFYTCVKTVDVKDLIGDEEEIPDSGLSVYAEAWIEEADGAIAEELFDKNNQGSLRFSGLLTKYESVMTSDTFLNEAGDGKYTVGAVVRNNSLMNTDAGDITVDVLDDNNNVLTSVALAKDQILDGEGNVNFTSEPLTIEGVPAGVVLRASNVSVSLNAQENGGVADTTSVELTKDGKLPGSVPEATKPGSVFLGWFTQPNGGTQVTKDTVLKPGDTLYAQFAEAPQNLTAIYGQTLSEIALPEYWSWADGTIYVGNVGKNTFKANYISTDVTARNVNLTVEVGKAPAVPATVSANKLFYTGEEQQLVKVTGTASGEMQYALGADDQNAPDTGWGTSIPAQTEVGTYYVWYRVTGDDNHFEGAPVCVTVKIGAYTEMPDDWNLFEDDSEHEYPVFGIIAAGEVKNSNKKSMKYYDATFSGSTITVKLKEGLGKGDRKKAARAANAVLEFNLGSEGVVEYVLPVSYVKPVFKLSSVSGTIKKGTESVLKTTLLIKGTEGDFAPYDMDGAEVKSTSFRSVDIGADDAIEITANAAGKGMIDVYKEGWDKTDPVSLKYTVKTSQNDVLTVDIGNQKVIDVNSNAKGQVLGFDISFNGNAPADGEVKLTDKMNTGLAKVEDGKLVVEYKDGVRKGTYTVTLEAGNAKTNVKIKVNTVQLDKCIKLKVQRKLNVVTGQRMIVVPDMKRNLNGGLLSANVAEEGFSAVLDSFGNITIAYEGDKYNANNLKIGKLTLKLYVDGVDEPVTMYLNNVRAIKTLPLVKAPAVVIPKEAVPAEGKAIGTANIISYVKLANGRMKLVEPTDVKIDSFKSGTAEPNAVEKTEINIKNMSKSSGSMKLKLTYEDGLTKNATIKVKKAKK